MSQAVRSILRKHQWCACVAFVLTLPTSYAADRVLVMGISQYSVSPLYGVKYDRENALQIARKLGFTDSAPTVLDDRALNSSVALLNSLKQFRESIQRGDRVFVYYSGHGQSRSNGLGKCEHGLVAADLSFVHETDIIAEIKAIASGASDVTVVMDACHSGGLAQSIGRTRNPSRSAGSAWVSKAIEPRGGMSCADPSNFVSRSITKAAYQSAEAGGLSNVVLIAAAGANEHAIDDPNAGGLATQHLLKCLDSKLTVSVGAAATMDDLVSCAQRNINAAIETERKIDPELRWLGQNVKIGGNTGRPLWAASEPIAAQFDYTRTKATLQQIVADQNQQWNLHVTAPPALMAVGDKFQLSFTANSGGYFSVLYASSDGGWCQLYPGDGGTRYQPAVRGQVGGRKPDGTFGAPTFTIEGERNAETSFAVVLSAAPPDWSHMVSVCDETGRAKPPTAGQVAAFAISAGRKRSASMREGPDAGSVATGYGAFLFSVKSR